MLLKTLEDLKPERLVITFDSGKPTFRKALYSDYKANRERPPEDLAPQFSIIHEAVDAFGIQRIQVDGVEADDIIGTLTQRAVKQGRRVEIVTGDKDLMQLVNPNVLLIDTMKGKRIDAAAVHEKFLVTPEQLIELFALMGDSSDNIPGVSGIGPKTAAELIGRYGTLEALYANLGEIKSEKRRETLLRERDAAFLSRTLATIRCDVDVSSDWETALPPTIPNPDLIEFLKKYEFTSLLQRLQVAKSTSKAEVVQEAPPMPAVDLEVATPIRSIPTHYRCIQDGESLRVEVEKLRHAPLIAIDTETNGLDRATAECVGISMSAQEGDGIYIPVAHRGPDGELLGNQVSADDVRTWIRPLLEDPSIRKVGQNLKFDWHVLKKMGIHLQGIAHDTLLETYLIDPEAPRGLDALALKFLGHQNISYEEVCGKGRQAITFDYVPLDRATAYAAEDADVALRLHHVLGPKLEENRLGPLYSEVEVPLLEILAKMEEQGIRVDRARLGTMSKHLDGAMKVTQDRVFELAGEPVNIHSPKQLSRILFEKLKLPVIKKTKTGLSTDESVLTQLASHHEICMVILKYRELGKLKSTYVEALLGQMNASTDRVHGQFNQTVTATGRLSSSNPNLQNIPITDVPEHDVRAAFIAEEGWKLLSADYSQIELRLLADMSGDPGLVRAFEQDEDVHSQTSLSMFGGTSVSPEQRRVAKTINFGVIYGQSAFGLSRTLGIPIPKAKEFIDKYFQTYRGVQDFLAGIVQAARKEGLVRTRLGRLRRLPDIRSQNRMRREMAERTAINTPIQGSAADLIKLAMIRVDRALAKERLDARLLLQVHDELVLEVPEREVTQVSQLVRREMESAMSLRVPLKVDLGVGKNWRETKGRN